MIALADHALDRVRRHLTDLGAHSLLLFKGPYLERRLRSRWRYCGVTDAAAYADVLDRDPEERGRLVSALALGVTAFFRNPASWRRLGELLPRDATVRAWSAGCATGEEAWSLAMLLQDRAAAGAIADWSVIGTDLDERAIALARGGEYPPRAAEEIGAVLEPVPGAVAEGRYTVAPGLRSRVRFRRGDLTQPGEADQFEVVLCRNVLIYFGPEAQDRVMRAIVAAIRPGGLLMLGKAELAAFDMTLGGSPAGAAAARSPRLAIVDRQERIYRRVE